MAKFMRRENPLARLYLNGSKSGIIGIVATRRSVMSAPSSSNEIRLRKPHVYEIGARPLSGGHGFATFTVILLENFMLNGLPEEFFFRGTILSYARCFLSTDWALFLQAMLFALAHYAVTINEEHGRPLLIVANIVGENAPMGLLFALMTLRSRSIAMSTIVHFSIDATTKMF
jgi:membrane protease YdiL (CAAX protease family)